MATQRTAPGWGWWLSQGATTCWEKSACSRTLQCSDCRLLPCLPAKSRTALTSVPALVHRYPSFRWPGDTSRNHIFLCGGFGEWLWKYVVGLQYRSAGFATVAIAPHIHGFYGPSRASGRFASPRGEILVEWSRSDHNGSIQLHVVLPPGVARATVLVPVPFGARTAAAREVVCASGSELGAKTVAINHLNQPSSYPKTVHLECSGGGKVSHIDFASYGTLDTSDKSDCGTWSSSHNVKYPVGSHCNGGCHANTSAAVVQGLCLGRTRCSVDVSNGVFGGDPCPFCVKTLAIRATCTGGVIIPEAASYTVREAGHMLWDGSKVVPAASNIGGIISARHVPTGVEVEVMSGDYQFEAIPMQK